MLTADARSRGRAAFLPSVTVPIALLVASVQPARAQLIGEPSTAETPEKAAVPRLEVPSPSTQRDANGVIDMSTLDPHDFRALAVRLPEGVAPRVDGRLDDDAWQRAPAFGDFTQRDPDVGAPSTHRTAFRIVYDDARIYIAIWAFEPHEGGVIASELERDSGLRKGDAVRVTFDTFHDHRNLFYFSTNPLAAMKDAFSSDNGNMLNFDWDSVWEVQTSVDDEGWYSEFAIPLSQLRFRDRPDQVWGVNVMRIVMHIREESSFVPLPREWGPGAGSRAEGGGLLLGLDELKPRRRFEFIPFLAPGVVRDLEAEEPTLTDWRSEVGADFRIGLSQTTSADLTFNTDFAQVEADEEIVNLTRFGLRFPERRKFFTEGTGTFAYGAEDGIIGGSTDRGEEDGSLSLFYSRRIGLSAAGQAVPILAGGRLTGSRGASTVGLLNVQTDATSYVDGDQTVRIPRANYTVARLKRNVLNSSSVGLIALNRQGSVGGNAYNRSLGIDGVFTLPNNVRVTSLFAKTFSPGIEGRDLAGVLSVDWTGDLFGLRGSHTDIQENFNAEMGFIPRVDIRRTRLGAGWTPRPGWPGVRQLSFGADLDYIEDHQGTLRTRARELSFSLQRNDDSNVNLRLSNEYDLLDSPFNIGPNTVAPGGYSFTALSTDFGTDDSRRLYGGAGADLGGYYGGRRLTLSANLNVLAQKTLLIENNLTRNRITLPNSPRYATTTLKTRVTYSVSPTLFLKAFVQYNDDRNLTNLNLLLWSIYRPGSDLYIVYNQAWETGLPGGPQVDSRSLSIKFTYWLSR